MNAQTPHTLSLLQWPCPPDTQPAWPSSIPPLPASQPLHLLALLWDAPRAERVGAEGYALMLLPLMPYWLPSTPGSWSEKARTGSAMVTWVPQGLV